MRSIVQGKRLADNASVPCVRLFVPKMFLKQHRQRSSGAVSAGLVFRLTAASAGTARTCRRTAARALSSSPARLGNASGWSTTGTCAIHSEMFVILF